MNAEVHVDTRHEFRIAYEIARYGPEGTPRAPTTLFSGDSFVSLEAADERANKLRAQMCVHRSNIRVESRSVSVSMSPWVPVAPVFDPAEPKAPKSIP